MILNRVFLTDVRVLYFYLEEKMKKFSFCLILFAALMFVVSCGSSKNDDNTDTGDTAPDGDIVDTGDTENPDTPDTSDTDDTDSDSPDSDSPDTDPSDTGSGWKTSDKDEIMLDVKGSSGQVQPKAVRTDDGKIILTWLRPEGADFDSSDFGYHLHLQIFGKDGKALFGDEGVVVSDRPTLSWTSDYSTALAPNGDILIAYWDVRNDTENKESLEAYLYRYDQEGKPVWSAEGVKVETEKATTDPSSDMSPNLCVSGGNIYLGVSHSEGIEFENYQIFRIKEDGSSAWESALKLDGSAAFLAPAKDGDVYVVYGTDSFGLAARRINADGKDVWSTPVTIEEKAVGSEYYMPAPLMATDEDGSLFLSYRRILDFSGYQVINRLSPDGSLMNEAKSCNGSEDGDAGSAEMGLYDHKALVVWNYNVGAGDYRFMTNLFDADGNTVWESGAKGIELGKNEDWGFTPVKVIPQKEGWVVLYGDATGWNTANFIVRKIDSKGETSWQRQIGVENMVASEFAVEYDSSKAYVFYTISDDDFSMNESESAKSTGLRAMCIDISGNAGE